MEGGEGHAWSCLGSILAHFAVCFCSPTGQSECMSAPPDEDKLVGPSDRASDRSVSSRKCKKTMRKFPVTGRGKMNKTAPVTLRCRYTCTHIPHGTTEWCALTAVVVLIALVC